MVGVVWLVICCGWCGWLVVHWCGCCCCGHTLTFSVHSPTTPPPLPHHSPSVLQQKCFQLAPSHLPLEDCLATPAFLATLQRVGERYFKLSNHTTTTTTTTTNNNNNNNNHVKPEVRAFCEEFRDQYFEDFVHPVQKDSKIVPRTLLSVANALEEWKLTLQDRLDNDERTPRYGTCWCLVVLVGTCW